MPATDQRSMWRQRAHRRRRRRVQATGRRRQRQRVIHRTAERDLARQRQLLRQRPRAGDEHGHDHLVRKSCPAREL